MSAFFAACSVGLAVHIYRRDKEVRVAIGILYFGSMELLQSIQYLVIAESEDDYAKCGEYSNQFLTVLGLLHICFQPFFSNWLTTAFYKDDMATRIEKDLIGRITLLGGCWLFGRYLYSVMNPQLAGRSSVDCPNYDWLDDGYDGFLGAETPNLPGKACTYRPVTNTAHLAWAVPLAEPTYIIPGSAVHCFLMFAPLLAAGKRSNLIGGLILFATGPGLAMLLTASVNEQASIWCFFSIAQLFLLMMAPPKKPAASQLSLLVHEGGMGAPKLVFENKKAT